MASIISINRSESVRRVLARGIDLIIYIVTGITLSSSSLIWIVLFTRTEWYIGGVDPLPLPPPEMSFETYAVPDLQPWSSIFAIHLAGVVLMVIPSLLYELPLTAARGQTVGKILMGIEVTHNRDEVTHNRDEVTHNSERRVPGWTKSSIRWAVLHLPLLVPIVGILIFLMTAASPLFDSQRRGWHDKIAGTLVTPVSKEQAIKDKVSPSNRTHKRLLARSVDWLLYPIAGVIFLIWSVALLELEGSTFIDLYSNRAAIEPFRSNSYQIEGIWHTIFESDFWWTVSVLHITIIVVLVSVVIYELPLVALRGETIGKILAKTRVVCIGNGRAPGWKRSGIRWIVLYLPLLAVPIIGVLVFLLTAVSPLFDPQRRGWHDKAAGTIVVPTSEKVHRVHQPASN